MTLIEAKPKLSKVERKMLKELTLLGEPKASLHYELLWLNQAPGHNYLTLQEKKRVIAKLKRRWSYD